jgi:hypothetical protein
LNDPKNSEQQTSVTIAVHGTEIPVIIDWEPVWMF